MTDHDPLRLYDLDRDIFVFGSRCRQAHAMSVASVRPAGNRICEWCCGNPSVPTIAPNALVRARHGKLFVVMRSTPACMPTPDRRCLLMNLNPTEPWTFLLLTSIHVAIGGGGCLFRTAPVLTRAQVRRVPVPPIMRAVRLLVVAVVLFRLVKEFC